MATYQGKKVTVVRVARDGDKGFAAGKQDQVIVRKEDGTEEAVPKDQVKDVEG